MKCVLMEYYAVSKLLFKIMKMYDYYHKKIPVKYD